MNVWLAVTIVLVAALVPLVIVAARRPPLHGIVALEAAGAIVTAALLLIAEGTRRQPFGDLALVLGALSFISAAVFLRFLERVR